MPPWSGSEDGESGPCQVERVGLLEGEGWRWGVLYPVPVGTRCTLPRP